MGGRWWWMKGAPCLVIVAVLGLGEDRSDHQGGTVGISSESSITVGSEEICLLHFHSYDKLSVFMIFWVQHWTQFSVFLGFLLSTLVWLSGPNVHNQCFHGAGVAGELPGCFPLVSRECWEPWLHCSLSHLISPLHASAVGHPTSGSHCHEWILKSSSVFASLAQRSESLAESRSCAVA